MKNKIAIVNSCFSKDTDKFLKAFISSYLKSQDINEKSLNIIFINEEKMISINNQYRKKNMPTDVITFSMNEGEFSEFSGDMLGDIYIYADFIKPNSEYEIMRRVFHGLLHIMEFTHNTDADYDQFIEMENSMLEAFYNDNDN